MTQIHNHQAVIPKRSFVQGIVIIALVLGAVWLIFFALPRIFAELQYPLAYEELIIAESKVHELDPFLVAAVIYAESRYRPEATSHVGARGLMQLMPATAQGIARRMGDADFTIDQLYDPATNIKYGTFHLQGLMGRYQGDLAPAIVAYNGGGGAGDRYQAGDRSTVPLESLRYVEKVLAAKKAYEELYQIRLADIDPFERAQQETVATRILQVISRTILERLEN